MHINDEAIILSARKFGERDLICQIFTRNHGLYSGLVRAGQSRKKIANYQIGNIAQINWKARLDDQLGTLDAEVTNALSGQIIQDSKRLMAVISASVILRKTLAERDPQPKLYDELSELLQSQNGMAAYVKFELALLRELGFGLDLEKCAVTGRRDNLIYISPASGRAVTAEGASGYEGKMLNLPCFNSQITESLSITEFFLMRNVFAPHNWALPEERQRLRRIAG